MLEHYILWFCCTYVIKEVTVLIGDKLSSQFSLGVLKLFDRYNIRFICLPPNSTDKTHLLDVAFLKPSKIKWQKVLNEYKTSLQKEVTRPKTVFPKLLKTLVGELNEENLVSGFSKYSIYQLNHNQLFSLFPNGTDLEEVNEDIYEYLMNIFPSLSGKDDPWSCPKEREESDFYT